MTGTERCAAGDTCFPAAAGSDGEPRGDRCANDIARVLRSLDRAGDVATGSGDAMAYFLALYRSSTAKCRHLATAIEQPSHPGHRRHRHLDVRLIRDIVVGFAARYDEVTRAFQRDRLADANPWRRVFRHAASGSPVSVSLIGAHTHIVFDLPMVLAADNGNGRPLFDNDDPRQRHTLRALNRLFVEELPAIVDNVRTVEARFAERGLGNVGGSVRCLYGSTAQRLAMPPTRWLLTFTRERARRHALQLRAGALDEADIGAMVDRTNRRLLTAWRLAGRQRRTPVVAAVDGP